MDTCRDLCYQREATGHNAERPAFRPSLLVSPPFPSTLLSMFAPGMPHGLSSVALPDRRLVGMFRCLA